jgi:hypothetical protein
MKKSLCLALTLLSLSAQAQVEPSIGTGASDLSMSVAAGEQEINYLTTNHNFTFLALKYKEASLMVKFPSKDPADKRTQMGDTQVTDYQIAFGFLENWHSEIYYQKYQGYFIEAPKKQMIAPDIGFSHLGGQVIYYLNPKYSPALVRESAWSQKKSAGSWSLGVGIDQFDLTGDLVPTELHSGIKNSLEGVSASTLSIRSGYGHNWIWKNWFAGGAFCLGAAGNYVKFKYSDKDESDFDSQLISSVSIGGGFAWNESKVGIFGRAHGWNMKVDDKVIRSSTSNSGVYFTSVF